MILSKIRTVPYSYLPVLIKSNECFIDCKSAKSSIQLIKTNKTLTENIETLIMGELFDICQSKGNIFSENLDILIVGAKIFLGLIVCLINLNDGFIAEISIVVSINFF